MADDHGVRHSSRVKRWTKCHQNDTLTPYMILILPIFTPKYAFFGKIECFFRKMVITLHIRLLPKPAFSWGAPHADGGRRQVVVNTIQEKRRLLDAQFLTAWNLANSMVMSGTQQRQMFMVARIASPHSWVYSIYCSAWASALLVQHYRAMREPHAVGRANGTFPRSF